MSLNKEQKELLKIFRDTVEVNRSRVNEEFIGKWWRKFIKWRARQLNEPLTYLIRQILKEAGVKIEKK